MVHGVTPVKHAADRIILNYRTTSYLKLNGEHVREKCGKKSSIYLADNSAINSIHVGVRKSDVMNDYGSMSISLSNTLFVPNASISLMSIPGLVKKYIAVLFMLGYARFLLVRERFKSLGYATQYENGLFYVNDDGSTCPFEVANHLTAGVRAMMAKVP